MGGGGGFHDVRSLVFLVWSWNSGLCVCVCVYVRKMGARKSARVSS